MVEDSQGLDVRPTLQALLIGILTGCFASTPHFWPLVGLSVVPLFSLIEKKDVTKKSIFLCGALFGIGYSGVVLLWMWNWLALLLVTNLPIALSLLMAAYSWSIIVGAQAVGYGAWTIVHTVLKKRFSNRAAATALSAMFFVVAEILNAFLFQLLFLGDGGTAAPHFAYVMIGYALGQSTYALQYAWLGGVWLLSFVAIFFNLCFWNVYSRKEWSWLVPVVILCALPGLFLWLRERDTTVYPTMRIGFTQSNFDSNFEATPSYFRSKYSVLSNEIEELIKENPEMIVLSEGNDYVGLDGDWGAEVKKKTALQTLRDEGIVLVDSSVVTSSEGKKWRAEYVNAIPEQFSEKRVLLAHGEYVPYLQRMLELVVPSSSPLKQMQVDRSFKRGELSADRPIGNAIVGTRFCSELISPYLYTYDAAKGATMLLNLSSHSWFIESGQLTTWTENMGRVHAAETGRWFIQAGNRTSSFAVNNLGDIVARSVDATPLIVDAEQRTDVTPYEFLVRAILYAIGK